MLRRPLYIDVCLCMQPHVSVHAASCTDYVQTHVHPTYFMQPHVQTLSDYVTRRPLYIVEGMKLRIKKHHILALMQVRGRSCHMVI